MREGRAVRGAGCVEAKKGSMMAVLLELDAVSREFATRRGAVRAVADVSFALFPGESVGLVGESGCGKSTVGRLAVGLLPPTTGEVRFAGRPLGAARVRHEARGQLQMIFQDPFSSLNPRWRVGASVAEPLAALGVPHAERRERVAEMLRLVGLSPEQGERYPHEFSGGQRQRVAIARAVIPRPRLVVCDEPVSALDVSVQAQVLNVLRDLRERFQPAYLFISHDLAVVRLLCARILVMYLGMLVEELPRDRLLEGSKHPYTQALLRSVPAAGGRGLPPALEGELPSPLSPPSGCPFHPRCPLARDICRLSMPAWRTVAAGHRVRCHCAAS